MLLSNLPRVRMIHLPTPLEEMKALSTALGGPRIFIKRDDCTGLAFGGNKTRKLEFLLADAFQKGVDTLITEGGAQSNHCRQTAAAAVRLNMDCILVLSPSRAGGESTGNLLLDEILGAKVIHVGSIGERNPTMQKIGEELKAKGKKPYLIPTGGSNGLGAMGYVLALQELETQANERGIGFDAVITASGSGGTQGGLLVGKKLLNHQARILGISDGESREQLTSEVLRVAREAAEVLKMPPLVAPDDVIIHDEYFGEGYGAPTPGMVEAVRLLARTEGILLDPVYSGKAMAGLVDLIRKGAFTRANTVVFLHTGGAPSLFAYRDAFRT